MKQVLRIDASARQENSYSRIITDKFMSVLTDPYPTAKIIQRDIYANCHFLSAAMVEEMASGEKLSGGSGILSLSNTLTEELLTADILVLAVPVYNFSIPAALKAYIDLVVRAGRTFRYGANGPEGLANGLKAYVIVTSNGTPLFGEGDFVSGYLRYILKFIGVSEIHFINGTQILLQGADKAMQQACISIDRVLKRYLNII